MRHLAISAIGRDHPGIVAAVTRVLLDHHVNVEDSQMTILRGRFTMMLIVSGPDGLDEAALRSDLGEAAQELGLDAVSVEAVDEPAAVPTSEPSHIVTVYGVDHPGIVHAVSARLAAREVNVTDLETRLVGEGGQAGLYAMVLEVALPAAVDPDALRTMLEEVGAEQGVEVTVRPLEPDVM